MKELADRFREGEKCALLKYRHGRETETCVAMIEKFVPAVCGTSCPFYKSKKQYDDSNNYSKQRCERLGIRYGKAER